MKLVHNDPQGQGLTLINGQLNKIRKICITTMLHDHIPLLLWKHNNVLLS